MFHYLCTQLFCEFNKISLSLSLPVGPVSTPSQESQQVPSAGAGDGAGVVVDTTQRVLPDASSSEPAAPTPPNLKLPSGQGGLGFVILSP